MHTPLHMCRPFTRVKICGITRQEDADVAVRYGASALGFVFYGQSSRFISIEKARDIIASLPVFVSKVALFVDPEPGWVKTVIFETGVDTLQFHGEESLRFCEQYGLPFIKAIHAKSGESLQVDLKKFSTARGILVDTYKPNILGSASGGTGEAFDWQMLKEALVVLENEGITDLPILLAGGLSPKNVKEAIEMLRPYAVDVSTGVEHSKGIKSRELMIEFLRGVYEV